MLIDLDIMHTERLFYIDICKFIAVFIVTWSHCAQRLSGMIWTNFLGGTQLDIAFSMPLFMMMSGWFINLEKMRSARFYDYMFQKFKRLIVPSFAWYVVHQILLFNSLDLSILTYYWYLNALFLCLCIIMICSKNTENTLICSLVSNAIVLVLPYSDFSHINFMMPFLWAGYGFRRLCKLKYAPCIIIVCLIIGLFLCLFWNHQYTVYYSPFNILYLDRKMFLIMVYRLIIGFMLSAVIIYSMSKVEKTWINGLKNYGVFSLVIYTFSLVFLDSISVVFNHLHVHINRSGIIDVLSLFLCVFVVLVSILIGKYCSKYKLLSSLFLGE